TVEQELGNGWQAGIHGDDLQRYREAYSTAFQVHQAFEIEFRLRRFDGQYRWVVNRGIPLSNADGSFAGYIGTCIDLTERRQEAEAQRFLTEAATILASSLEFETTFENIGRLVVPKLADWYAIDLVSDDLTIQQTVVSHSDPAKVALAGELRKRFP